MLFWHDYKIKKVGKWPVTSLNQQIIKNSEKEMIKVLFIEKM